MKIRINGNFVRLRLTQSEVDQFEKTGIVKNHITFGQKKLNYELLAIENINDLRAHFDKDCISVQMPATTTHEWATSEIVSIENKDQTHLRILVEKDFQCLHVRVGEDESDHFPNPLAP